MKSLTLPESEIKRLIAHYEQKLSEAEARLSEIKGIIKNLEKGNSAIAITADTATQTTTQTATTLEQPQKSKRGRKKKIRVEEEIQESKNEPLKKNWVKFVVEILKEKNELLTAAYISEEAMIRYEFDVQMRMPVSRKLTSAFSKLIKDKKVLKQRFVKGESYFYGLSEWLMPNGKFDPEYLKKFENFVSSKDNEEKKNEESDNVRQITLDKMKQWQELIIATLKQHNKVFTVNDFKNMLRNKTKLTGGAMENAVEELGDVLNEMVEIHKTLKKQPQKEEELDIFGLPDWFMGEKLRWKYEKNVKN